MEGNNNNNIIKKNNGIRPSIQYVLNKNYLCIKIYTYKYIRYVYVYIFILNLSTLKISNFCFLDIRIIEIAQID